MKAGVRWPAHGRCTLRPARGTTPSTYLPQHHHRPTLNPRTLHAQGFSKRLVFEVLNEPKAIGFPTTSTGNANAMRLCNAAVQAIRSADPDRPILVGSPGLNDAEFLEYVTIQFLPYTFGSGGSFYNDPNVGVAFHFYEPRHPSIVPGLPTEQQTTFAMWDGDLILDGPETEWRDGLKVWQAPIKLQFDFVDAWRNRSGHGDIPVVTTEWGCWMFESRSKGGDLRVWLDYTYGLFLEHDVGQMWYVGVMSNQYAYTIFDSETGWDATVLPKLTGKQPPTSWPHINQVLNGEFLSHSSDVTKVHPWVSAGVRKKAVWCEIAFGSSCATAGYSGDTVLELTGKGGSLSIETYAASNSVSGNAIDWGIYGPPDRTLLHLIQGVFYSLRFIAGSKAGSQGVVRARLMQAGGRTMIHQFAAITVSDPPTASELTYMHGAADAMDVRLEFDFGDLFQVVYLDKVELVRRFPPPPAPPSLPPPPSPNGGEASGMGYQIK